jgi:hypothetical protein
MQTTGLNLLFSQRKYLGYGLRISFTEDITDTRRLETTSLARQVLDSSLLRTHTRGVDVDYQ